MPWKFAFRTVLQAGEAVTISFVDIVGQMGPVQFSSSGGVQSSLARVAGQSGIIANVKEAGA